MIYPILKYLDTQCPLCGNSKAQIKQIFKSEDIAKHLNINKNNNKYNLITMQVENLWNAKICYFVHCINCTFDYAMPNIPGDSKFYNIIYDNSINYSSWKWEFEISYKIIEENILRNKNNNFKLLEIGAGNGNFLKKIATNLIPKENILATEFSSFGKNEIINFGIQCLSLDINNLNLDQYKNFFDFVCMFQILEHISNISDFFNHLTLITNNHANLLISVPNEKYRYHFNNLGLEEDLPPIHINRWNKNCFSLLAKSHGWVVINHIVEPSNYLQTIIKLIFYKNNMSLYLNLAHTIKIKFLRKIVLSIIIIPLIFLNLKIIIKLNKKNFGISQFVHLKKIR